MRFPDPEIRPGIKRSFSSRRDATSASARRPRRDSSFDASASINLSARAGRPRLRAPSRATLRADGRGSRRFAQIRSPARGLHAHSRMDRQSGRISATRCARFDARRDSPRSRWASSDSALARPRRCSASSMRSCFVLALSRSVKPRMDLEHRRRRCRRMENAGQPLSSTCARAHSRSRILRATTRTTVWATATLMGRKNGTSQQRSALLRLPAIPRRASPARPIVHRRGMRVNAPRTIVSGYNVRRTRFASDANIVGRRIVINDAPTTVIGVLPQSFDFATVFAPGSTIDLYSAFPLTEENDRRGNTLAVVGRLKPGVTIEKARAEITAIGKQLTSENRRRNTFRPKVVAFDERINGRFRPALFVLSWAGQWNADRQRESLEPAVRAVVGPSKRARRSRRAWRRARTPDSTDVDRESRAIARRRDRRARTYGCRHERRVASPRVRHPAAGSRRNRRERPGTPCLSP